jgi:hypothetical protein
MSGLKQIALNAVAVVGLYFLFLSGRWPTVGVRSLFFLWILDCWDWTVDCGRSDALFFYIFIARRLMVAGRGEENDSGGLWRLEGWEEGRVVLTYYAVNES